MVKKLERYEKMMICLFDNEVSDCGRDDRLVPKINIKSYKFNISKALIFNFVPISCLLKNLYPKTTKDTTAKSKKTDVPFL